MPSARPPSYRPQRSLNSLSDDNEHDAMQPGPRPAADAQDAGGDDRSGMATPAS